jgi:hypothetical protein
MHVDQVEASDPFDNRPLETDVIDSEDSMLESMDLGEWNIDPEEFEDFLEVERRRKRLRTFPKVTPSQFVEIGFRMPADTGGFTQFSFNGRRHMRRPYDTPCNRVLLVTARQVEKSTLLGNTALTYSCLVPGHRALYVSPSATQTKTFSNDRLKEPIETSDILKAYTTTRLSMNVFEKQFINWAKITLRYAFLNADRVRGIPAWMLLLDELQDILADNIPVIEQCTGHAPEKWKRFRYAGTPKSLDNVIEYYRSRLSTQGEWVVPCDSCGSKAKGTTGRFWNILGEKNIGKEFLICERCGKRLHPQHDDAQWAFMVKYDKKNAPFESYRIPQLMVPWKKWDEILLDYKRYPRNQFYNEVLGLSFDSGMRPLTISQVREQCNKEVSMHPDDLVKYEALGHSQDIFAGIDWGTGENTYTVLTLGTYVDMKFRIFYIHRFTGEELEPPRQLAMINEICRKYSVSLIGADYGGGFDRNDHLVRKFGPERVQKFQYMAKNKSKVEWDSKLRRWKVHRTEVMSDIFNAIKRGVFEFPKWEEFQDPHAQDFVNIFSEYNESQRQIQYSHNPDRPDDAFHSTLYCFLVSMIKRRRPDVIAPRREEANKGPYGDYGGYDGPKYQG